MWRVVDEFRDWIMRSSAHFALAAKQGNVARQERREAEAARRIPIAVTHDIHAMAGPLSNLGCGLSLTARVMAN